MIGFYRVLQGFTNKIDNALQDVLDNLKNETIVEVDNRVNKWLDRVGSMGNASFRGLIILVLIFNMKYIIEKTEQYAGMYRDIETSSSEDYEQEEDGKVINPIRQQS